MTVQPLVSVVIATYNMARFLPLAIRSALDQSYSPIEIHVVDDGSTDATGEILKTFAADPRVRCHRQPNCGQARAKNRGIRESRGELIAFLDADDTWTPTKLSRQVPLLCAHERAGVVYSDVKFIDEHGQPIPVLPSRRYSGSITGRLFVDNCVPFPTAVVRRECIDAVGGFDESLPMGIDWDLWLRISTRYEFVYVDEPTAHYRVWSGQMSNDTEKRFACALTIMERFAAAHPGVLSRRDTSEAWAHTLSGQARRLRRAGHKRAALRFYAAALRWRPGYWYAWRGIGRLGIERAGIIDPCTEWR